MKMPAVEGIIERRLLVNYRVAPGALAGILPAPFRPKLVGGYAIAGICLIRLASVRPRGLPAGLGLRSENAAHRIAVEWDVREPVTIAQKKETPAEVAASSPASAPLSEPVPLPRPRPLAANVARDVQLRASRTRAQ